MKNRQRTSVGRPSKYRVEHCDIVEGLGRKGKGLAEMAAILNVDRASLYRWAKSHEDFAQSLACANTFAQAWWEEQALQNLTARHFQSQTWRTIMAARFKDDYAQQKRGKTSISLREALSTQIEPIEQVDAMDSRQRCESEAISVSSRRRRPTAV